MSLKPTLNEYEELAKEINFLCSRLTTLSCKIGQKTGVSKEPYKLASDASKKLDKCKSMMEDLMFNHYPGLPREATKIFYHEPKDPQE